MALGGSLGLGIVLTASDLASGTIKSVAKSFAGLDDAVTKAQQKFASKLGKNLFGGLGMEPTLAILRDLGKATAVASVGLAGLSAAFKLADNASDFEFSLAELRNTTKLSAEQVEAFKQKSLELGASGPIGPRDTAAAFRELASSTLSGKQSLDALGPTVDLLAASFGRLSPQQAGGLVSKTLEAFPELANNATHAVDLLARAFKGGLKPEEVALAMNRAAKGAKFLGTSLEEVLSTLGGAKGAGLQVSRLNEQTLKDVSFTAKFLSANGQMRRSLMDTTITAKSSAEAMSSTWKGLRMQISSAFETLGLEIGLPLLEALKPVVARITAGIQSIAKFVENLSAPVKSVAAKFLIFGSVALVLGGVKMALAALVPVAGAVVASLAPVLATGALIAGGAYLIYKAWETNFGGIRDLVQPIFDGVSLAVRSLVALFTEGEISGALADDLLKAENGPIFDFVESISRLVANVKNGWADISSSFKENFGEVQTDFGSVFGSVVGMVTETLRAVGGIVTTVVGILSGNMNSIMRGLATVTNAGIDMVNGLITKAATALEAIGADSLAIKLNGLKLDKVSAQQVAFGLGADETAASLGEEDRARASARSSSDAGVPGSASASGTTSGIPSSGATTKLPSSRPATAAPAASGPEPATAQLVAAIEALGKRPVVVNGVLTLDGMKLSDWSAKQRRDRAAAAGAIHQPYHGYGHDSEQ